MKPELSSNQSFVLSAFYRLSQERVLENGAPLSIKDKDVDYFISKNGACYPDDLFLYAIRELDGEYIEQKCKEINKARKGN